MCPHPSESRAASPEPTAEPTSRQAETIPRLLLT
jgi:hypothetical protein